MTQAEAKKYIAELFLTQWNNTTHVTLDNETDRDMPSEWVRLAVRHSLSQQDTLGKAGNRKFGRSGFVYVQVFTPVNAGSSRSDVLAEQARNIFEGNETHGIAFTNCIAREIGPDGRWYQQNVEVYFTYFTQK